MSQMSLRLPASLHRAVKKLAAQENVSANQFITLAVAEKVSALMTAGWIERRSERAPDRDRSQSLLGKPPKAALRQTVALTRCKTWLSLKDVLHCLTSSQPVKDALDRNPSTTNHRLAHHYARIGLDVVAHGAPLSIQVGLHL